MKHDPVFDSAENQALLVVCARKTIRTAAIAGIGGMDQGTVKEASGLCKQLFKSKATRSPDIAEASSKRCRLRLMSDSVFGAQRNLARAFHMSREHFKQCIRDTSLGVEKYSMR